MQLRLEGPEHKARLNSSHFLDVLCNIPRAIAACVPGRGYMPVPGIVTFGQM